MLDVYREQILEHFRNPKHFGKIEDADLRARDSNPVCGDDIEIFVKLKNGKIEEMKFSGEGCALCMAAADILAEYVKDLEVEKIKEISNEDIFDMVGIHPSPMRVKCVLLALFALRKSFEEVVK